MKMGLLISLLGVLTMAGLTSSAGHVSAQSEPPSVISFSHGETSCLVSATSGQVILIMAVANVNSEFVSGSQQLGSISANQNFTSSSQSTPLLGADSEQWQVTDKNFRSLGIQQSAGRVGDVVPLGQEWYYAPNNQTSEVVNVTGIVGVIGGAQVFCYVMTGGNHPMISGNTHSYNNPSAPTQELQCAGDTETLDSLNLCAGIGYGNPASSTAGLSGCTGSLSQSGTPSESYLQSGSSCAYVLSINQQSNSTDFDLKFNNAIAVVTIDAWIGYDGIVNTSNAVPLLVTSGLPYDEVIGGVIVAISILTAYELMKKTEVGVRRIGVSNVRQILLSCMVIVVLATTWAPLTSHATTFPYNDIGWNDCLGANLHAETQWIVPTPSPYDTYVDISWSYAPNTEVGIPHIACTSAGFSSAITTIYNYVHFISGNCPYNGDPNTACNLITQDESMYQQVPLCPVGEQCNIYYGDYVSFTTQVFYGCLSPPYSLCAWSKTSAPYYDAYAD
jgi:hypothetical protein